MGLKNILLKPWATPVQRGVFPLAFSMTARSPIALKGETARAVPRAAAIYCGPKSQKEVGCSLLRVINIIMVNWRKAGLIYGEIDEKSYRVSGLKL